MEQNKRYFALVEPPALGDGIYEDTHELERIVQDEYYDDDDGDFLDY